MKFTKKITALLLSLLLLLSLVPTTMAYENELPGIPYDVEGGTLYFDPDTGTIIACTYEATAADIPAEINGIPVTTIGYMAFVHCENLTRVTIPDSVTTIDDYAFLECDALPGVDIPDSVTRIGNYAFYWCDNLESVTIPNSVTTIGDMAFYHCKSLAGIAIPDSVTTIGDQAFAGCESLTDVTIGNGLTAISYGAFAGCDSIKSITIPDNVRSIEPSAFYKCKGLTSISIGNGVTTIGEEAFAFGGNVTSIIIGKNVKTIEDYAFASTGNMAEVYYVGSEEQWKMIQIGTANFWVGTVYHYNYTPNTEEPVVVQTLKPSHSLNLQNNISINYMVPASVLAQYDSYEIKCDVGDCLSRPEATEKDGYIYFTLTDLNALEMNTVVRTELYAYKDGKTYVSPMDEYSILTYATNMMNREGVSLQVKKLCANLLRYGATFQAYKGYDMENLPDAALTEEQKTWLVDTDTVEFTDHYAELNDMAEPQVTWYGKTLILDSTVSLKFVVDAAAFEGTAEDLELRVTYVNIEGETCTVTAKAAAYSGSNNLYAFVIDQLNAAELRTPLSCRVYAGEEPVSCTMTFSADSYCVGRTGSLLELCRALFAYVDTARAFFTD